MLGTFQNLYKNFISTGIMIGHVTPEAYDGGPIALVEEGDTLTISRIDRTINLVSVINNINDTPTRY